ncbi:SDR family NAD(P)-dependent oxidoreductase [Streptomyces sp. NBC_01210]|uniref:SDR family NAD(P)-dependent oxidoreductase n=1 Tax=Streptomyces sp. NBC_01210 TaxID=2903774 RepID=UPI002E0EC47D|nr:SDR family NAD(P)-dependent oxidoreductase [Streptomyces sp. NBC_01210]
MKFKNLKNRVVLITGAGSGMGRETALLSARRGATLVICDRDEAGLKETAEAVRALGSEVLAHTVDVTDPAAMDAFADAVHARFDAVDVLINNAGIGVLAKFFDTKPEDWDRQIAVNLKGVVHGCERFIPRMIERGTGGHVVNVSSGAGYFPSAVMSAYSVTKFAVFGLTLNLRIELRPHKIGVTAICPGVMNTPIIRTSIVRGADAGGQADRVRSMYMRRGYPPERAAEKVLRAVGRNRAIAPVGPDAHAMYALNRLAPPLARWISGRVTHMFD